MFQLHCFAGSIFFLGLCTASVLAFVFFTITELSSKPFSRKHTFTWLLFNDISSYAQSSTITLEHRIQKYTLFYSTYKVAGRVETFKLAGFTADGRCVAQLKDEER